MRGGKNHWNWNGGKVKDNGYVRILKPDHPRADCHGYVHEAILIAEKAIGGPLPEGAVMHHLNGDKADNCISNLMICKNGAYHTSLHRKKRAFETCGHRYWRKCILCKKYDDPKNFYISADGYRLYHRECRKEYDQQRKNR